MPDSRPNILFEYEYRDAANYKKFGYVVFRNPDIDDVNEITQKIRNWLFDQDFFYPYQLKIPPLYFDKHDPELDHNWYRFVGLEFTDEAVTDERLFGDFLTELKTNAKMLAI